MSDDDIKEMVQNCVLSRTRLISRVLTGIYDEVLRPFGISSPQFVLLTAIYNLASASRSEIGRFTHQDRSTLSRNIKLLVEAGLVDESDAGASGRARPMVVTDAGVTLLTEVVPAWREGQAKAANLLGKAGASAVMTVGDQIFYGPEA